MMATAWGAGLAILAAAGLASVPAQAATSFDAGAKLAPGGTAVAVSADGLIAVVGDALVGFPGGLSKNAGAIRILARSASGWKATAPIYQQALSQHDENHFGASVAISPDGSTVVAGAPHNPNNSSNRAEVFTVTIGSDGVPVATRVAVLAPRPDHGQELFGTSVAVTRLPGPASHTIVAVGAPDGTPFVDSAFLPSAGIVELFVDPVSPMFSSGMGDLYGTDLIDTGTGTAGARMGTSVAISPDATTIVAGAPQPGPQFHAGAVDVFTGSGTTYALTQRFAGATPGGNLGASVAISADASTAIGGEPMTDLPGAHGDAQTFCLTVCGAGGRPTLPAVLVPRAGWHDADAFGTSVALSGDGVTALVGAPYTGYNGEGAGSAASPGSVYVEDAAAGGAAPAEQVLVPQQTAEQGGAGSYFGHAVALSSDGLEALTGAPNDTLGHAADFTSGWAFVWNRPAPVVAPAVAPPVVPPVAPSSAAAPVKAVLACAAGELILTDVFPLHAKTQLVGVAPAGTAGQKVALVSTWNGKTVASATVQPDLSFSAAAPLPAAALRTTNKARYVAKLAGRASRALKFARRLYTTRIASSGSQGQKISFTGTVIAPLQQPPAKVEIRASGTCAAIARGTIVAAVKPSSNGAFTAKIKLPQALSGAAVVYLRAETTVRETRTSRRTARTYSLVRGIAVTQ